MSATDENLATALDEVEFLAVDTALLEYYTSLTEHHRTKLSVIGAAYLTLSQLMLLTPMKSIEEAVGNDKLLFIAMLGLIVTLLILGILHHAANIAMVATQRLNVLRNLYWIKLPHIQNHSDKYEQWRKSFEPTHRDSRSVSWLSLRFALAILVPIFLLTLYRFHIVATTWLTGNYEWLVLGAIYTAQVAIAVFYLRIIHVRATNFYHVRNSYKIVQSAAAREECLSKLSTVCHDHES